MIKNMTDIRKIEEFGDNDLYWVETWLSTRSGFVEARRILMPMLQDLPVRSRNIIRRMYGGLDPTLSFYQSFFRMSEAGFKDMKDCGRKSLAEILEFRAKFRAQLEQAAFGIEINPSQEDENVCDEKELKEEFDLQELEPEVKALSDGLSVRCANAVLALFIECDDDIMKVYERLSEVGFKGLALRNVGKKTYPEFQEWCNRFKALVEEHLHKPVIDEDIEPANMTADNAENVAINNYPDSIISLLNARLSLFLPDIESRAKIIDTMCALGHFPYFFSIKAFIDTCLDEREAVIMKEGFRYKNDLSVKTTSEIASRLSLSEQRVSQMRQKLFKRLLTFSRKLKKLLPDEECPYECEREDVCEGINKSEGTEFNSDFIHWIIGSIFPEYIFIGNPFRTLITPFTKKGFVTIVPVEVQRGYDFMSFLSRLDALVAGKRDDINKVSLRYFIAKDLKRGYKDLYPEVRRICLSIIKLYYNLEIKHGCIVLEANIRKPISELAYEIIRKNGAPMTVKQIALAIEARYPGKKVSLSSLGNSVLRHPKVRPIGRSNTYTLKSWKKGAERGGTIREFTIEYLKSLDLPIAPEKDICEYVRRFRPTSSERSIISNLLQESTHKFALYEKDGGRYIGLSKRKYPESYKVANDHKRPVEESMRILEEFILANGRFPSSTSADKEERRLYRFVGYRRYACSKGAVSSEEADKWQVFEERYKEFDLSQKKRFGR